MLIRLVFPHFLLLEGCYFSAFTIWRGSDFLILNFILPSFYVYQKLLFAEFEPTVLSVVSNISLN